MYETTAAPAKLGAIAAQKASPVENSIHRLESTVTALTARLETLAMRLQPVLTQPKPEPATAEGNARAIYCAIDSQLSDIDQRVDRAVADLSNLIDRLAI